MPVYRILDDKGLGELLDEWSWVGLTTIGFPIKPDGGFPRISILTNLGYNLDDVALPVYCLEEIVDRNPLTYAEFSNDVARVMTAKGYHLLRARDTIIRLHGYSSYWEAKLCNNWL